MLSSLLHELDEKRSAPGWTSGSALFTSKSCSPSRSSLKQPPNWPGTVSNSR